MKKRALLIALLSLIMITSSKAKVEASCTDISRYGAVSIKLPVLPSTGTYNIWTKMQIPDSNNSQYRLEINGNSCFEVGGSSINPGQWQWVSFQDGDLSSKVRYNFENKSSNTAKIIGSSPGVMVDRLLLIKNECIPIDDGENCQSENVKASNVNSSGATVVPPPSTGQVSGLIIPSQTISVGPETIARVVYSVDGKQIPTAADYALDTTMLSNGPHQVAMQITKTNGTLVNEVTTLDVSNPQTVLSPLRRWARLNQHSAVVLSSVFGGILVVVAGFLMVRHLKLQKRLLTFRGF